MKMAVQKLTWNIRKSSSSKGVVVVEGRNNHVVASGRSVRIQCCSETKIHILRGDHR